MRTKPFLYPLSTVFRYVPLCTITTRPQWPRSNTKNLVVVREQGSPVQTHSSSPNATGAGGYSSGDAERCYLQGQAEARQPLAGSSHQNSTADVKHREPEISLHVLDARLFRAGKRAVEDCHVVLQPVSNWRFRRKGNNVTFCLHAAQKLSPTTARTQASCSVRVTLVVSNGLCWVHWR